MPRQNPINNNQGSRPRVVAVLVFVVVVPVAALLASQLFSIFGQQIAASEVGKPPAPAFVSSATCAECHSDAYKAWQRSHHSWALREPTPENVLGDFDDTVFEHHGVRSRFYRRDGRFFVETDGPNGKLAEFEIKYTVGVTPLQQYLAETERGRLQTLDLTWDTQQKRWFYLHPGEGLTASDGLHWTRSYKNWQARCAECHQTNFIKGYSSEQQTYQSKWSELTVGCEACHGPGEAHVAWAKDPASYASRQQNGLDERGLSVSFPTNNAEREIQVCAPCHSRRSSFGPNSPPPGSNFSDHYRLALLTEGRYYADGQIDDEVYVYGSFLQSTMYARGIRCSDCHEPHSGALRAEGNAVCTQCHRPDGNTKFPTLRKAMYDNRSHHHHEKGSEGARCVSCHMPAKTYMEVDPRRDHSFRIPRPDLTQKIGTPNACTGCHDGKSAEWATATLKDRFPAGRTERPHYGEVLHAGRTRLTPETVRKLIELAFDGARAAIVRATALDLLRPSASEELLERVSPLLRDESALLRTAVLPLFQTASPQLKTRTALTMFNDPVRSVRIEAAKLFLGVPLQGLTSAEQETARRAIADYRSSLSATADFPETRMQIGGLAMTQRKFNAAQDAFRNALALDPQLADAWITLARIQWALRHPDQAIETLEQATKEVPDNGEVFIQLGALYLQQRQHAKAVVVLEKSIGLGKPQPQLLDMLVVSYLGKGDINTAQKYARQLVKEHPSYQPSLMVRQILQMNQ